MLAADLHNFLTFHGTTLEIRLKVKRSRVVFSVIRCVVTCVEQSKLTETRRMKHASVCGEFRVPSRNVYVCLRRM